MSATIEIIPYQPQWVDKFGQIAEQVRTSLGDRIIRVDHIGSTSVPGMPAKDVIDMQITVETLDAPIQEKLEELGFKKTGIYQDHRPPGRDDIPEAGLRKHLYMLETPRVNLHVREQGAFNQEYAILCRDYLRANKYAAQAYAEIKKQLAKYFPDDVDAYYDIKDPVFDLIMEGAYLWKERQDL
ncbi:GrpB-like predicted nucleotidyltransferase (UPF0157 family) [Chitinophaga terrae (ex Kim and Jung 2007)]|uniref:GrpB family protein n=1 Tax=Chitinophaga terrae (ex Kim and Jung 2007) TaxID=408074 RepID=UPI0027882438|nr:GrpB family protein [Chitinophaga terrae (ex Kim and Jung 2007)]MDQ0109284.1 GrpB-like predicted nucleotidyltransferase (UPF0157 family) [Chitinophaga terrae (ex Kim and Jung 2007)]